MNVIIVQVLVRNIYWHTFVWRVYSGGEVPEGAVLGGHNGDKEDLYICLAKADKKE